LAAELRALTADRWVIIDEVQRLPHLLNEVQRFIEAKRRHFIQCGSSARKLKRADVNPLAGRAVRRAMHPFVPEELAWPRQREDAARQRERWLLALRLDLTAPLPVRFGHLSMQPLRRHG
jgi:predicted AAA+ superfamily ATPase